LARCAIGSYGGLGYPHECNTGVPTLSAKSAIGLICLLVPGVVAIKFFYKMPFIGVRLKENDWPIEYAHSVVSLVGIAIAPTVATNLGVNAYLVFLVIATSYASVVIIQSAVARAYWLLFAMVGLIGLFSNEWPLWVLMIGGVISGFVSGLYLLFLKRKVST